MADIKLCVQEEYPVYDADFGQCGEEGKKSIQTGIQNSIDTKKAVTLDWNPYIFCKLNVDYDFGDYYINAFANVNILVDVTNKTIFCQPQKSLFFETYEYDGSTENNFQEMFNFLNSSKEEFGDLKSVEQISNVYTLPDDKQCFCFDCTDKDVVNIANDFIKKARHLVPREYEIRPATKAIIEQHFTNKQKNTLVLNRINVNAGIGDKVANKDINKKK